MKGGRQDCYARGSMSEVEGRDGRLSELRLSAGVVKK